MKFLSLTVATGVLLSPVLRAAPVDEHVRGTIVSITVDSLVVRTEAGAQVPVGLNAGTHYLQVVRSSLDKVAPGSYIGSATKSIGSTSVALEVMIFPAAMQGLNAGHFPYDRLTDTTVSGKTTVTSNMTNGNAAIVTTPRGGTVDTAMTNGNVSASASQNGVRELTVTYPAGRQTILVPPTAPIVNLLPARMSDISKGDYVFVDAARSGSTLTAGLVAAGAGGLKPPF